jgi:hypothetical protein
LTFIIKNLSIDNIVNTKIEGTKREFSSSYRELQKKGEMELLLDNKRVDKKNIDKVIDNYYNFTGIYNNLL